MAGLRRGLAKRELYDFWKGELYDLERLFRAKVPFHGVPSARFQG